MSTVTTDLRYPIGKAEHQPFSEHQKKAWLNDIKFLPQLLENAIINLDEPQLLTPYREGGWTVQQLVHHVADSHMNAYCRFKLGLTEENPTIKPYDEAAYEHCLTESVEEIVRQQAEAGIDIVSDGEFSKGVNWAFYIHKRLKGITVRIGEGRRLKEVPLPPRKP